MPLTGLSGALCSSYARRRSGTGGRRHMALKDQVLAALEAVRSPDGTPLPKTGALSEVVASDGKVFFSISVDAGAVNAWEPVRKRVEEVVRAVPGVKSAMIDRGRPCPARTAPAT